MKFLKNENENLKTWQRIVSASAGAVVTSVLVTPLDVIKIRLQAQSKPLSNGDCFIYCNGLMDHICQCINGNKNYVTIPWYKKPGHFNNSFDAFKKIVKSEGALSLWSGLSPTLVMAIPQVVIYYTLNDWLKYVTGYENNRIKLISPLCQVQYKNSLNKEDFIPPICGAVARLVAQATIAPLELLRTKMQSKKLSYREVRNITSSAIRQGGLTVLWRGMGPTTWRDLPYTITLWFIYEYLKRRHMTSMDLNENASISYPYTFLYSACGAAVAGLVSHPFDVTKTHRQIELGNAIIHNQKISSSTWAYLKRLKTSQGYSSLLSGFYPRMFRVVIATAVMITIFETSKDVFIKSNKESDLKSCFK